MKYSVEVYIPGKEKYSGKFEFINARGAAQKALNNLYMRGLNGNSLSVMDIEGEILTLKSGENFMYWCDAINGASARVTAI